jgi:predicted transcriptional regulator
MLCAFCNIGFQTLEAAVNHHVYSKCSYDCSKLQLNIDYVICSICNLKAKSLSKHIKKYHGITNKEYFDKYGDYISKKSRDEYKNMNQK